MLLPERLTVFPSVARGTCGKNVPHVSDHSRRRKLILFPSASEWSSSICLQQTFQKMVQEVWSPSNFFQLVKTKDLFKAEPVPHSFEVLRHLIQQSFSRVYPWRAVVAQQTQRHGEARNGDWAPSSSSSQPASLGAVQLEPAYQALHSKINIRKDVEQMKIIHIPHGGWISVGVIFPQICKCALPHVIFQAEGTCYSLFPMDLIAVG